VAAVDDRWICEGQSQASRPGSCQALTGFHLAPLRNTLIVENVTDVVVMYVSDICVKMGPVTSIHSPHFQDRAHMLLRRPRVKLMLDLALTGAISRTQ
jgi:hypothetical protein